MRISIKLIGVTALLALSACSDGNKDEGQPSSSSGGGDPGVSSSSGGGGPGACLIDMKALTGGNLDYQQCTEPYDDEATCTNPAFGGEYRSSCPPDPVCERSIDGMDVKFYGQDAGRPCGD